MLIAGIILFTSGVYAATVIQSLDVTYDNSESGLEATNVQDALDELYLKVNPPGIYSKDLLLGDYVSYTPRGVSFTPDSAKTNSSSNSEMDPSELNLWRVLSIDDVTGTVDIISENVTSSDVYFYGKLGYQNLVGYLNELASKYETEGITVGSRHFGYSNQTKYITKTDYFENPPWHCATGDTCVSDWSQYEEYGGGDTGYTADYNLVNTVLGTRVATNTAGVAKAYWMASRKYSYSGTTIYYWYDRYVDASGADSFSIIYYRNSSFFQVTRNYALRPIVTLDAQLLYEGAGTSTDPYRIKIS